MGTGISMSSINKIKELAESGDYSLALDILEHQDLQKSLSPQFIRICGEVYYENGRYKDARQALVKAHSMAPMGNKILFSIIKLYLALGLYDLVDRYEEIYKYNQSARDAGQLRIEYMKAKADRKPVSELISILISANDIETNETWDYEMLLLYYLQGNTEKLKIASEDFLVLYKGSAKKEQVEKMVAGDYDAMNEVYCYGPVKTEADYPDMQDIKEFEDGVLEEDYLRMYPKDPKIMIMVEDNAPVTNSMKFKQMLVKNKDKREAKKIKKEQEKSEKGEKKGLFGRGVSRKDEEAYEETLQELEDAGADTDTLLDEITATDNEEVNESVYYEEDKQDNDNIEETTEDEADTVELDEAEAFDTATEDFDVDNEPEADMVIMIDPEDEIDIEQNEISEEVEDAEVSYIPDADIVSEIENDVPDLETEFVNNKDVDSESGESEALNKEFGEETAPDATYYEEYTEPSEPSESADYEEYAEPSEPADYEEYAEPSEPAEESESADAPDEFNFDSAFKSLNEFDIHMDEDMVRQEEDINTDEEPEEFIKLDVESDDSYVISEEFDEPGDESSEYEEMESAVELEPDFEFEPELEFEVELEEPEATVLEPELEEPEATVLEPELEEPEATVFEPEEEDTVFEPEITETEDSVFVLEDEEPEATVFEPEEEDTVFEPEITETEDSVFVLEDGEPEAIVLEPEMEEPEATVIEPDTVIHKPDFPVFKTSLFPEYNSKEAPVFKEKVIHKGIDEKQEEEIKKNLHKEEQLLRETDMLLARLGIELGTDLLGSSTIFSTDSSGNTGIPDKTDRPGDETDFEEKNKTDDKKENPFKLKR